MSMSIERIAELREQANISDAGHWPASAPELLHLLRCARAVATLESKGSRWVFRESESGRGWRLHQSFSGGRDTYPDPLTAIEAALARAKEEGRG